MNKILLSIGTVLTSVLAFGQITINIEGQSTDISGSTHYINTSVNDEEIIDLLVHNNTGATQEWNITRKRIDAPTAWTDFLCWGAEGDPLGGQCYGASQMNTNPWMTPQSLFVNNNMAGLLAVHVTPAVANGLYAKYRYYVGRTVDNPQDSVDIVFNQAASLKKVTNPTTNVDVYPNPANDYLTVSLPSNAQEGTVKISDVLGKVVFEEKISTNKKLSTEDFKNGVYILSFQSNGNTYTKRFVVKH